MATTNQNQILHSQKTKRKVSKHKISGNHPTKKKKKKEKGTKETESTEKLGLKWQ